MNLSTEDLIHCLTVLSGDIKECEILGRDNPGRYDKRIEDDKRVIARIERITGKLELRD